MENKSNVMHSFNPKGGGKLLSVRFVIFLVVIALLGVGTGFVLSRGAPNLVTQTSLPSPKDKSSVEKGKVYGSNNTSTFKDSVEGKLLEGGIDGEGQYHLERPGGDSQNVYMTSSSVDLSLFINHKIKVWGETQKAQKAGWLMDVGRVEVLE